MATLAYSGRIAPTVQPALLLGPRLRWGAGQLAPAVRPWVASAGALYWGVAQWLGNSQTAPAVPAGVLLGPRLRWGAGGAVIQATAGAQSTMYYLRGWDSSGQFVYWSSVGAPDVTPMVTSPALTGTLGNVCIVGMVKV